MDIKTHKNRELILGIETSCDDTSFCLLEGPTAGMAAMTAESSDDLLQSMEFPKVKALFHYSSEVVLKNWGGVVPEIAARNHSEKIPALMEAMRKVNPFNFSELTHIAVTTAPGLLGPLLTGLNFAKSISLFTKTPIIPVNHLFAHLEAIHLTEFVPYPYLGLLISGGNSNLYLVKSPTSFQLLGRTLDDAAGEAFDKGGKLMGLPYPAGKYIDQLAKKGDPEKFTFPIGLKQSDDCNMSFSGVKTHLRTLLHKESFILSEGGRPTKVLCDLAASYQSAIANALVIKTLKAYKQLGQLGYNQLPLVVGGGVACNSEIRKRFVDAFPGKTHFVLPKYCTDNGAMIANYALRTISHFSVPYPECLQLDASSSIRENFCET